ncbi:uncharacterized protein LOC131950135 [Physella acuta]|uniref:uncharacterized protein LOC131950135 n=1 Tax=Physella acuta TaxID=109671 RepID=UPI0027DE00B3|nr:uncharacterized protein LOC131950135 [Physella acuta]XP_059168164.1 uncharacterized protein LOC131950135 [Physella acuta]XP_059168165.1 uncharacterized protein LOC131950135 [Physella acuta]
MPILNTFTIFLICMTLFPNLAAVVTRLDCTYELNRITNIKCSSVAANKVEDCKFYINTKYSNLTAIENATELHSTLVNGSFQNNCSLQISLLKLGPGDHTISAVMTLGTEDGGKKNIKGFVEIKIRPEWIKLDCTYYIYNRIAFINCSSVADYKVEDCKFYIDTRFSNLTVIENATEIHSTPENGYFQNKCNLQIPLLTLGPGFHEISAQMILGTEDERKKNISGFVEIEIKSSLDYVHCFSSSKDLKVETVQCCTELMLFNISCDFKLYIWGAPEYAIENVSYNNGTTGRDSSLCKDWCMVTVPMEMIYIELHSYSVNMSLMNGSEVIEVKNSSSGFSKYGSDHTELNPACEFQSSKLMYPGETRTCTCTFYGIAGYANWYFNGLKEVISNLTEPVPGTHDRKLVVSYKDVEKHKVFFCGPETIDKIKHFIPYSPLLASSANNVCKLMSSYGVLYLATVMGALVRKAA